MEYGNNLESKLKKDNREMKGLIDQVRNAKDPKATADAANAVQLANLKFEKMKFQYEMYRDKQKDMAAFNAEQNKANFEKQQLEAKPTDYSSGWNEYYNEHQSD